MNGFHLYPALLLAAALAAFVWRMRRRGGAGPRYPRLLRGAWLGFGLPAVLLLGLDGAWPALWRMPAAFDGLRRWLGVSVFDRSERFELSAAVVVGLAIGAAVSLLLTGWRASRGRADGVLLGDARAVIPTDPRDFRLAALVAASAGVTEEAYFRLLLPLLTAEATGSAALGFAGASLLFGWGHRYRGRRAVAATTVMGGAIAIVYLATASLALVMALHAVVDMIHLVARPALRWRIERRRAARGPLSRRQSSG